LFDGGHERPNDRPQRKAIPGKTSHRIKNQLRRDFVENLASSEQFRMQWLGSFARSPKQPILETYKKNFR
jgi:hypothetical protein